MYNVNRPPYSNISLKDFVEHRRAIQHNAWNVNLEGDKVPNVWHRKQQQQQQQQHQQQQQQLNTEYRGQQRTKEPYMKLARFSYNADTNYEDWPTIGQSMTNTSHKVDNKNKQKQKTHLQQQQRQQQQQLLQQQLQQQHQKQSQQQLSPFQPNSVSQHIFSSASDKHEDDRSLISSDFNRFILYKQRRLRKQEEEQSGLLTVTSTSEEGRKTEHDSTRSHSVNDSDNTRQLCRYRPTPKPRHTRLTMELNTDSLSSNEKNPISAFMEYGQARGVTAKLEQIDHEGPDNEPILTMELNTDSLSSNEKNPISAFMEYGQARGVAAKLEPIDQEGPDNEPIFTVAAFLNDEEICRVRSKRIKDGRATAADKALRKLNSPGYQILYSRSRCLEAPAVDEASPLPSGKDPVSALLEYAQAHRVVLSFSKLNQSGPPHQPVFTMVAQLGNRKFGEVQGSQLKQTKKKAAIKAINAIDKDTGYFSRQFKTRTNGIVCSSTDESVDDVCPLGKNPVSVLMEYAQATKISVEYREVKVEGPDHRKIFTIAAVLGHEEFPKQTGTTKKEAERKAAVAALRSLKERRLYHMGGATSNSSTNRIECKTFEDKIAALCQNKFDELVADIPDDLRGRKVIAAIILIDEMSKEIKIVSMGSGNRFITGDKLSMRGNVITDSHAEIIAKRGFRRYLYYNIWSLVQGNEDTVMEYSTRGKYRIREGISYHLYISTAPCGDGAMFSHSEPYTTEEPFESAATHHAPIKDNEKQGQLRTKMENGEGTIPIDVEVQSWDGIMRGDRLRTMSCSDKICSWNVLGVQGALLSNLMEPVYLRSITLGKLFSHGHLCRAVCCRVDEEDGDFDTDLPEHYSVNHPKLGQVTAFLPSRNTEKSRAYSMNWNITDTGVEVTDGTTGLLVQSLQDTNRSISTPGSGNAVEGINSFGSRTSPSRLSKKSLYKYYKLICEQTMQPDLIGRSYRETKRKSREYQFTKGLLKTRFLVNGCGYWLSKPEEIDIFV